jgi:hypothetical protein
MRLKRLTGLTVVLGTLALLAAPGPSNAASIVNGGFESGSFTGWTVVNQPGFSGDWFVYTGTNSPLVGLSIDAPPEGTHAAVTDQRAPGSHLLYQDVALEAGFDHQLSFFVYYRNSGGDFATPPTLDAGVVPNQQYRIDVLPPTAPVTSVAPGDVLATVFQTNAGDPLTLAPTPIHVDLSAFAGMTVRLRFAEVDNQGFFNASVDAIVVQSTPRLPTTKDQCKNGGWRTFGSTFKNQGDCVSFVASTGKNPPALTPSRPAATSLAPALSATSGPSERPYVRGGAGR